MNNSPQSATQPQIQNTVEENQTSTNAATEQQPKQIQRQPPAKPPQRKPYRRKRSTDPPDPNQPKIATLFKPIEKESKVIKKQPEAQRLRLTSFNDNGNNEDNHNKEDHLIPDNTEVNQNIDDKNLILPDNAKENQVMQEAPNDQQKYEKTCAKGDQVMQEEPKDQQKQEQTCAKEIQDITNEENKHDNEMNDERDDVTKQLEQLPEQCALTEQAKQKKEIYNYYVCMACRKWVRLQHASTHSCYESYQSFNQVEKSIYQKTAFDEVAAFNTESSIKLANVPTNGIFFQLLTPDQNPYKLNELKAIPMNFNQLRMLANENLFLQRTSKDTKTESKSCVSACDKKSLAKAQDFFKLQGIIKNKSQFSAVELAKIPRDSQTQIPNLINVLREFINQNPIIEPVSLDMFQYFINQPQDSSTQSNTYTSTKQVHSSGLDQISSLCLPSTNAPACQAIMSAIMERLVELRKQREQTLRLAGHITQVLANIASVTNFQQGLELMLRKLHGDDDAAVQYGSEHRYDSACAETLKDFAELLERVMRSEHYMSLVATSSDSYYVLSWFLVYHPVVAPHTCEFVTKTKQQQAFQKAINTLVVKQPIREFFAQNQFKLTQESTNLLYHMQQPVISGHNVFDQYNSNIYNPLLKIMTVLKPGPDNLHDHFERGELMSLITLIKNYLIDSGRLASVKLFKTLTEKAKYAVHQYNPVEFLEKVINPLLMNSDTILMEKESSITAHMTFEMIVERLNEQSDSQEYAQDMKVDDTRFGQVFKEVQANLKDENQGSFTEEFIANRVMEYTNNEISLTKEQLSVSHSLAIFMKNDKKPVLSAPAGFGKTRMMMSTAVELCQLLDKQQLKNIKFCFITKKDLVLRDQQTIENWMTMMVPDVKCEVKSIDQLRPPETKAHQINMGILNKKKKKMSTTTTYYMIDEFDELFFSDLLQPVPDCTVNDLSVLVNLILNHPACMMSGTTTCEKKMFPIYKKLNATVFQIPTFEKMVTDMLRFELHNKVGLKSLIEEEAAKNPVLCYGDNITDSLSKVVDDVGLGFFDDHPQTWTVLKDPNIQQNADLTKSVANNGLHPIFFLDESSMVGTDFRVSTGQKLTLIVAKQFKNSYQKTQCFGRVGRGGNSCTRIQYVPSVSVLVAPFQQARIIKFLTLITRLSMDVGWQTLSAIQ